MDGNLLDGLTGADEPGSGNTFEDGLRAAISSDRAPSGAGEPSAPEDPALSTGQEVVRALLDSSNDGGFTSVAEGFTTPAEPASPPPKSVQLSDGQVYSAEEIDAAIARAGENEEELISYRDSEADQTFRATLEEEVFDEYDLAAALGDQAWEYVSGNISAEQYAEMRATAALELAPSYLEPDSETGEYYPAQLEQVAGLLDRGVQAYVNERRDAELAELEPQVRQAAAEEKAHAIAKGVLPTWMQAQGLLPGPLTDQRIAMARAAYAQANRTDMFDDFARHGDADRLLNDLSEFDAHVSTALKVQRDSDFKARMLSSTADMEEGLVIGGVAPPIKFIPIPNGRHLDRTVAAFKGRQRGVSPAEVRANFSEQGLSDGWTLNGRPMSYSEALGQGEGPERVRHPKGL